jgi:hypothetical protein
MAPDDRDRTFEKALARHLRPSASAGVDANALTGTPAERPAELCPDPEILAAYHDGLLSFEERNFWKQHVVGCDHCQFVLAHLETPLEIPVNLETNENVAVLKHPVPSGKAASPAHIARPSPPHTLRWLWLVPAGAIAATLIVWVSLNEPKPSPLAPPPSVEIAENRQPASAAPSSVPMRAIPKEREEKDQPAAPSVGADAGAASANRDLTSQQSQNQVQLTQQSPFQAAAKPAHGPSLSQQKQEQQIMRAAPGNAGAFDKKKSDAEVSPSVGDRLDEDLRQKAAPPQPLPAPSEPGFVASGSVPRPVAGQAASGGAAAPAAPAPAPSSAANVAAPKTNAASADASSAVTESVEVSTELQTRSQSRSMLRAAALQNPHVFAAPGAKQLWRIGPAGSLEHSKDKGLNWTPQISGVYNDLLAGSAPSGKVCWIVGASGTILRSTDGGTHWTKLDSPVTNDLTGIHATDAMRAQIWFVVDPQTGVIKLYQTADGGVTWSPVSTQ